MHQVLLHTISLEEFQDTIKTCLREIIIEFKNHDDLKKSHDELLTVKQVAKLLNVTKATLHNWHKNGKLMPQKIEGRVLYTRDAVMAAIKNTDRLKYKNVQTITDAVYTNHNTPTLITTSKKTNV